MLQAKTNINKNAPNCGLTEIPIFPEKVLLFLQEVVKVTVVTILNDDINLWLIYLLVNEGVVVTYNVRTV